MEGLSYRPRVTFPGTTLHTPLTPPSAGVVVLHGSGGARNPWSAHRAAQLAHQGFVAAAFAWFGCDGLSPRIQRIPLDRTEAFLRWFRAGPAAGLPVVLFGASRGAEHALLLASLLADTELFEGVAAHAGIDRAVRGYDPATRGPVMTEQGEDAAWTWRGEPLYGRGSGPPGVDPRIPIEDYPGRLWLSHGDADETWSVEGTRRLAAARGELPTVTRIWPGEGHGLRSPDAVASQRRSLAFFIATTPSADPADFVGAWSGRWGGVRPSCLVVDGLDGEKATVRYEIDGQGTGPRTARLSRDGTLAFGSLTFRLSPDGATLHGLHERHPGRIGGVVAMHRGPLPK